MKNSTSTNTANSNNHVGEGGGTIRHRKKSRPAPPPPPPPSAPVPLLLNIEQDLEIRNPSELLVGVPVTLKAQWRHKPGVLVIGTVDYIASVSTTLSTYKISLVITPINHFRKKQLSFIFAESHALELLVKWCHH